MGEKLLLWFEEGLYSRYSSLLFNKLSTSSSTTRIADSTPSITAICSKHIVQVFTSPVYQCGMGFEHNQKRKMNKGYERMGWKLCLTEGIKLICFTNLELNNPYPQVRTLSFPSHYTLRCLHISINIKLGLMYDDNTKQY